MSQVRLVGRIQISTGPQVAVNQWCAKNFVFDFVTLLLNSIISRCKSAVAGAFRNVCREPKEQIGFSGRNQNLPCDKETVCLFFPFTCFTAYVTFHVSPDFMLATFLFFQTDFFIYSKNVFGRISLLCLVMKKIPFGNIFTVGNIIIELKKWWDGHRVNSLPFSPVFVLFF